MSARDDERYICDTRDRRPAVLEAWWGDLPMGGWADDDREAFHAAVIDQLEHDLLSDGSATMNEIVNGIEIGEVTA